jgi:hypothetical protein
MVVRSGKGYRIKNHATGKVYPKVYRTADEAEKRIRQMEMFSHMKRKGR